MSLSSNASLGALRIQAQQRSDLENSPNISTPEWNQYISQSYKELYDMLVSAYGNDYYVQTPYQFSLSGSQLYPLPSDFYKLLRVEIQYSGSPSGYVTLRRFETIEANRFAFPNTQINSLGYTNLQYRIWGSNLQFIPVPQAGQTIQIWYVPEPTPLQFIPTCSTTISSAVVTVNDVADLAVGMNAFGTGIATGATILSINTSLNQVTLSAVSTATQAVVPIFFWTDGAVMDGISGWEEYVVIDAAIKAQIKQECDVQDLLVQKNNMKMRIESMAEGRDIGQASHVSDVLSINGWGYDGFGGGGDGSGWGY